MYTDFASVYDRLMRDVPYQAWADFYLKLVKRHAPGARCVECACGTGGLTIPLARAGLRMTGVDLSGPMLELAMAKARDAGVAVPFVRQDMRALSLPSRADAVLCTCDGVNYLTKRADVLAFFRAAHEALKPGGALIFDVSTPYKLGVELGTATRGLTDDDCAYLWNSVWQERTRLFGIRMDIFVREGGNYRRIVEEQTQRAHSREELSAWLAEAGFTAVRFYGDKKLRPPVERDLRWHIAAIKDQARSEKR
ncbi:MAG: methyltransferase domain-containing protein [Clostridia bacterium]|nr:methyltransferase domain-containing protein [Clostridia bacterium]